jgi:5'-nucleotidase
MGQGVWTKELDARVSPRGFKYYWMVGEFRSDDAPETNSDWNGLHHGYVTVTPTKIDITAYEVMEELSELIIDN